MLFRTVRNWENQIVASFLLSHSGRFRASAGGSGSGFDGLLSDGIRDPRLSKVDFSLSGKPGVNFESSIVRWRWWIADGKEEQI
jgi:hypothetical protein